MTDEDLETVPVTLFPTERQLPSGSGRSVIQATVTDADDSAGGDADDSTGSDADAVEYFCRDWQAYLSEWPESLSNL